MAVLLALHFQTNMVAAARENAVALAPVPLSPPGAACMLTWPKSITGTGDTPRLSAPVSSPYLSFTRPAGTMTVARVHERQGKWQTMQQHRLAPF